MDIYLIIVNITFHQKFNYLATHISLVARSRNADFLLSSVESSRWAASSQSIMKAKCEIKQISGFTKSFS